MKVMTTTMLAGSAIGITASAVSAQTFFASRDTTLYRFGLSGGVDTFELADTVVGMAQTADGRVFAMSGLNQVGGQSTLYQISDLEGTPTLVANPSNLTNLYTAITAVGNTLYGFRSGGPGSTIGRMVRIDPDTGIETELATFNELFRGSGGAAYNPATDTMWVLGDQENTRLFTVDDYEPAVFGEIALTEVGPIGFNSTSFGMEYFNGTLYTAIAKFDTGSFTLGYLDQGSGAFTGLRDIELGITGGALTGLFVIPSPSTVVLLGAGGLLASRRRRS